MTAPYNPPPKAPVNVIFHDEHLIVLNKPSGLLSVPGRGPEKADCLLSRAKDTFPEALIVHRLDMETSGLIVLAQSPDVHRALSHLFETRAVRKSYVAHVYGNVKDNKGHVDLPLIADWPNRPLQKVDTDIGKSASTYWTVLERKTDQTRLLLAPKTGRTHQLRVHLNAIGHPILGDSLYGSNFSQKAAHRLQLHASELEFVHPATNELVLFQSTPPF